MLTSARVGEFLACLYGDEPRAWRDDLEGFDRLRVVVNACTRLRFCSRRRHDGAFAKSAAPSSAPEGFCRGSCTRSARRPA